MNLPSSLEHIQVKRIYDDAEERDGFRVLVDRLWPRGIRKDKCFIDDWAKDWAPSSELRRWFGHDPAKFAEFSVRYEAELAGRVIDLRRVPRDASTLTLLYAAKDPTHHHAGVLCRYLLRLLGERSHETGET